MAGYCNFPGCKRGAPAGKDYCMMHNKHFGSIKIKAEDKSEKRAKQEKEYLKKKKAYLAVHPVCEVRECTKGSNDVHHMAGREGDLLTDDNYFLAVCRHHHDIIERNPLWAKQEGYSVSRLAKNSKQ